MKMKTAIVIGSNKGLGLELCRQLKEKSFEVIAVCRKSTPELAELNLRVEEGIDLQKPEDIEELASRLEGLSIDLLFHNSGVLRPSSLEDLNIDSLKESLWLNSIAPLLCSTKLAPLMTENSTLALMSSRMGSIADNDSGGSYAYRMSKSALNAAGKSLSIDLRKKGVCVAIIHPGYVKTDMTKNSGHITPMESVTGILKVLQKLNMDQTGKFWHSNGEELPW